MNNCLHWDVTAADADGGKTAPAAWARVVRHMIVVVLVTAAALDLTRCGLVMASARCPAPTAGLVTAGGAAAHDVVCCWPRLFFSGVSSFT